MSIGRVVVILNALYVILNVVKNLLSDNTS